MGEGLAPSPMVLDVAPRLHEGAMVAGVLMVEDIVGAMPVPRMAMVVVLRPPEGEGILAVQVTSINE